MGQTAYSIAMQQMKDTIAKANLGEVALEGVYEQLADIAINVRTYGAVGDGSDETLKIQAAIDAAGPNSQIIGEPGKTYVVRQLLVNKTDLTISDISLKLANGNNTWVGVIKIIGTREQPASNITLRNVNIDGNRTNQTGIPVNNPTEARTGIAINGVVSNVLVENCVSKYNAGDGIWIYSRIANGEMSGTTRTTDSDPCFRNIKVINCTFSYNRRHGGALDSLYGGVFQDCVFEENGKDINGGTTDGDKGETYNGNLYGTGFDLESYGNGTAFRDITFLRCSLLNNASRALAIGDASANFDYPGFLPRGYTYFRECTFKGLDTEGNSFYTSPTIANRTRIPRIFTSININDCNIDGKVLYQSVDRGELANNTFNTVVLGSITIDNSNNLRIFNQFGIVSGSVFQGSNAVDNFLMMENNNMKRPIISVNAFSSLPSSAANGTIAFIESPSSTFPYACIRQGGSWRPLSQQIGPTTIVNSTVPGTQNKYVPIRDVDGTLLGYIALYS